ncbi:MAG: alpha-1,2-fucosyltransferase [Gammaproteobacteria bacterium]|nr:alpha-1,2-fucosyltransferase [Gammaproteobacteria bacterium]MBU1624061.1 alpha-1,2-fucosyltransferase [Gammaproteobacteria bacterium]MBU1981789.1 alpha-1,2-fucosyltransferase [Gammaproteobacteria bacterium]
MKIPKIFRRSRTDEYLPTVVIFAGGMGTQIIQAATYFSLKEAGQPVFADMSYFDTEARMAEVGNAGQLTHWFWQLDQFGLTQESFEKASGLNKRNANLLADGPRMMELGLAALKQPSIQNRFGNSADVGDVLSPDVLANFLCIHIRRGDYVNVASHLIADEEFVRLMKKFSGLVSHAVILSDSPIPEDFRAAVTPYYKSVSFLDNIDPYKSHQIMRSARTLICSNSTFSLTAAMLNPEALVVIPKKWYGGNDSEVEAPIQACCTFQVMK